MPDNSQLDDGDEQILSAADRDLFATITKHLRPGKGTVALNRFIVEHASIVGSFLYTTGLATRVDEMRNIARKALRTGEVHEDFRRGAAFKRLVSYSELNSRNLVVQTANNLLCYVSEILQLVAHKRPEILRAQDRLTTEEVLQFSDYGDLIAFIADRKINELAYGGLRAMSSFVDDRLGIGMFADDAQRMLITILVELRNVHTHNRGIINRLFLNRVGCTDYDQFTFVLGSPYHADLDAYAKLAATAIEVALTLDAALVEKFGLDIVQIDIRSPVDQEDA